MANSNEAANAESSQLPESKAKPSSSKKTSVGFSFFCLPTVTLFIALFALLFAIYATYQSWQLNQQKQTLTTAIDALGQRQQEVGKNLDKVRQFFDGAQVRLQKRMDKLNTHINAALQQRLYQKQDWVLLKARYYLELAQINAQWSDNQGTTAALLQEADHLLQGIPDQGLYQVRQAIAREIALIEALPRVDIAGIMSKLDAAQTIVSQLPISQSIKSPNVAQVANNDVQTTPSAWRTRLRESLNLLEKLVVVRHDTSDIKPILSPLHQALLRESIRMNLQEAQWAVLQNNPNVFEQSLNQALTDITRTFEKSAPPTQSLVKELQALQQITLNPSKPVISESLPLLNQLIESKNKPAATTQGDS